MIKFEKVSRLATTDFNLPVRKTKNSAGYDFEVAEDIVIPSYNDLVYNLGMHNLLSLPNLEKEGMTKSEIEQALIVPRTLEEMASLTKTTKAKPTLVSTGVKCYLDEGYYLELSVRSSTPLKYWLVLANGVGIIDADYADNEENEGEIFFQVINLSPFPIALKKGDIIGQGIIKKYEVTDDDSAAGARMGGFGSTSMVLNNAIDSGRGLRASTGVIDDYAGRGINEAIRQELNKDLSINFEFTTSDLDKATQKTMIDTIISDLNNQLGLAGM